MALSSLFLSDDLHPQECKEQSAPLSLACQTVKSLIQITVNISFEFSRIWSQPQAQT